MPPVDADNEAPLLAIVIPTHRARYLADALASLAAQTDQRFVVYVGDDASKDDIASICRRYAKQLDLHHHRFDHNLGRDDLVGQWARSVQLSDEPWVWMIGDDDQLESGCVAALHAAIEAQPQAELFHFAVRRIDAVGQVTKDETAFPPRLTARRFLQGRMSFALASYAPDFVFARRAFEQHGGFQNFPLAWCSDDATWVKLAGDEGIHSVVGPRVRWRLSGSNISTRSRANALAKTQAQTAYLEWLSTCLPRLPRHTDDPSDEELRRLAVWWYFEQASRVGFRFWPWHAWPLSRRLARAGLCSFRAAIARTVRADFLLYRQS